MDDDGRAVYVSVCGRVERVELPEMSLEGLCDAVSSRFDIGDQLRFTSDEDGEPEVTTDEQLKRLAQQRHTLRVVVSDSALSDLEQRMWQLRQLQWGFFQDELARVKVGSLTSRNEVRKLRQMIEQSSRREVELQAELMNERQLREKGEHAALERHEAITADLRREQRQHDATEATLRKEIEDVRQLALKFSANGERQTLEVKGSVEEETRNRGKNIEALLAEWASSHAEIRQALEGHRGDIDQSAQDHERHSKGLLREASSREAFEQFFGEKIRNMELNVSKLETNHSELDARLQDANAQHASAHRESQSHISELRESRSPATQSRQALSGMPSLPSPAATINLPISPGAFSFVPGSIALPLGSPMVPFHPINAMPTMPGVVGSQQRSRTPPPMRLDGFATPPQPPPALLLSGGAVPMTQVVRRTTPPPSHGQMQAGQSTPSLSASHRRVSA